MPLAAGRWDGRWQLEGAPPAGDGLTIGALGAGGLKAVGRHPEGIARETLATTPAIWHAGRLVAAPLARPEADFGFRRVSAVAPPWRAEIVR